MRSSGGGLSAWELAGPLAITGFGMGMVFVPMFDVILAGVAPHQVGSASGLLESVQQLSMSLGIAVVGTVLFDAVGTGHGAAAFVGAANHAPADRGGVPGRGRRGGVLAAQARAPGGPLGRRAVSERITQPRSSRPQRVRRFAASGLDYRTVSAIASAPDPIPSPRAPS